MLFRSVDGLVLAHLLLHALDCLDDVLELLREACVGRISDARDGVGDVCRVEGRDDAGDGVECSLSGVALGAKRVVAIVPVAAKERGGGGCEWLLAVRARGIGCRVIFLLGGLQVLLACFDEGAPFLLQDARDG